MAAYNVTTAGAKFEFEASDIARGNQIYLIDSTHFLTTWGRQNAGKGFAQVMAVNTSTWAITTAATSFNFGTGTLGAVGHSLQQVDTNHFINFWTPGFDNYDNNQAAESLVVNTTTWAVTTAAARLTFDTRGFGRNLSSGVIDTNHFICFYNSYVDAFTVNTSTWAITTASTKLQFETQNENTFSTAIKIDTNHYINFWAGGATTLGTSQIFVVNTTTFAVTTAGARFDFTTQLIQAVQRDGAFLIDSTHVIYFHGDDVPRTCAQVFAINTTTWAITTAGASKTLSSAGQGSASIKQIDSNHFAYLMYDQDNLEAGTITVDTSTWAVTTTVTALSVIASGGFDPGLIPLDASGHYIGIWGFDSAGNNGEVEIFYWEPPAPATSIKTINGLAKASVKTVNGLAIASVKTWNGLA